MMVDSHATMEALMAAGVWGILAAIAFVVKSAQ
jgi:hypothetical protein